MTMAVGIKPDNTNPFRTNQSKKFQLIPLRVSKEFFSPSRME